MGPEVSCDSMGDHEVSESADEEYRPERGEDVEEVHVPTLAEYRID